MTNSQTNASVLQLFSSSNTAQILHDTIFIDGTDPNNDWDNYEFITGTGSLSDPYNIEDLIIEIGGETNGITILNSHKSVQIKNCIISHKNDISSDNLMSSIGIYLQNCTNIQIKWCSANLNSYGILLSNTSGVIIEESDFINNKIAGIYSNHSTSNYFKENDIKQNKNTGILMEFSYENTLSENNVSENYNYGIHLKESNHNIIRDNFIQDNGKRNIFTEDSVGTIYSGNIRKEQWIDGFIIELSSVVLVTVYVIYKGKKHDKIYEKDKKNKEKIDTKKEE